MAWRAPEMQIARSSFCAVFSALRSASSVSGWTMRQTRAELSCEWMSLTRMPGGGFAFCGVWGSAMRGQAAPISEIPRKSRRLDRPRDPLRAGG
jgi:hypothetical protein